MMGKDNCQHHAMICVAYYDFQVPLAVISGLEVGINTFQSHVVSGYHITKNQRLSNNSSHVASLHSIIAETCSDLTSKI